MYYYHLSNFCHPTPISAISFFYEITFDLLLYYYYYYYNVGLMRLIRYSIVANHAIVPYYVLPVA